MIELLIPASTPSTNQMLRKFKNLHVRSREQKRWDYMVYEALKPKMKHRIECCDITIHRIAPRPLDWDNMGGGLKFLMDALIHCDVIIDDNPKVIKRLHLEQVFRSGPGSTKVEIIPLLDGPGQSR